MPATHAGTLSFSTAISSPVLRFAAGDLQQPISSMTFKRLIISIAIMTLLALALYLLIATRLLREPSLTELPFKSPPGAAEVDKNEIEPSAASLSGSSPRAVILQQNSRDHTGSRLIEIFGRVMDQQQQPIEGVLITEERYFFNTRSDAQGNYRILLDLPKHRYPALHFLRHGYSGKRVKPDKPQLQRKPVVELNLALDDNPDSVRLSGWVGNDAGVALAAVRVELTALETGNGDNFYLTVFTDANGNFNLEGVGAGERYRLSVKPAPEYQGYQDNDFVASPNPEQINIVLNSLKLVNIDGMILNPQSAPIPNFELQVSNVTTGIHSRKIVSDASGFFSLKDFPLGAISLTSRLASRGAEYFKISGLTLTDDEYRNLMLIVDKGSHYLSGWVSDENGIGVAKAMVTMTAIMRDGSIEYFSYRSQSTDHAGRFAFTNVGGGEHQLSVYANGFDNHDRVHRFDAQSDEIQVSLTRPN